MISNKNSTVARFRIRCPKSFILNSFHVLILPLILMFINEYIRDLWQIHDVKIILIEDTLLLAKFGILLFLKQNWPTTITHRIIVIVFYNAFHDIFFATVSFKTRG